MQFFTKVMNAQVMRPQLVRRCSATEEVSEKNQKKRLRTPSSPLVHLAQHGSKGRPSPPFRCNFPSWYTTNVSPGRFFNFSPGISFFQRNAANFDSLAFFDSPLYKTSVCLGMSLTMQDSWHIRLSLAMMHDLKSHCQDRCAYNIE